MNCKHVQDLLPLYVGGDLEEKSAIQVSAHLQSCPACSGDAAEYRESMRMLQQYAPPPFSESDYAGIRQRVLTEIEQKTSHSTLSELVGSLFRPGFQWAGAASLLLALSALVYFFAARQTNTPQVSGLQTTENVVDEQARAQTPGPAVSTLPPDKKENVADQSPGVNTLADPNRKFRQKKTYNPAASFAKSRVLTRDVHPKATTILAAGNNVAGTPASDTTLRMEMQTADPNIRIIWFTNQPTKQNSRGKSSKGI